MKPKNLITKPDPEIVTEIETEYEPINELELSLPEIFPIPELELSLPEIFPRPEPEHEPINEPETEEEILKIRDELINGWNYGYTSGDDTNQNPNSNAITRLITPIMIGVLRYKPLSIVSLFFLLLYSLLKTI